MHKFLLMLTIMLVLFFVSYLSKCNLQHECDTRIVWQIQIHPLDDRRERANFRSKHISSYLEMFVSSIFVDCYLNSPPLISLTTSNVLQLRVPCPFVAAWPFCLRLIWVLSPPFIVSGQTAAATSFCVIKFS